MRVVVALCDDGRVLNFSVMVFDFFPLFFYGLCGDDDFSEN
jgi:hypothetical protein